MTATGQRRFYSDGFRRRILELRALHGDLELAVFARAVLVPEGTVEGWLRAQRTNKREEPLAEAMSSEETEDDPTAKEETSLRIQSIIAAWRGWSGLFGAFVDHVRNHLRIPYGHSFISRILFAYNERIPHRRGGRSPDEKARDIVNCCGSTICSDGA